MARTEMVDLAARYTAGWNSGDPERVAACFSPAAVMRDIAVRVPLQGREGIRAVAADFMAAFPDISRVVSRVVCEDDLMSIEWHLTGTHGAEALGIAATGRHVEVDGCSVAQVGPDGLISTLTNYWDVAGLLHQLGVLADPTHEPQRSGVDQPEGSQVTTA